MIFNKLIIKNFKKFKYIEIPLNKDINIIVGNNESGKSTILEAINLVTTAKLNGKSISTSLSGDIFNKDIVSKYLDDIKNGNPTEIPEIEIELYAEDIPENSQYKGKNNILVEDLPGISLSIVFNSQQYEEIYKKLVEEKKLTELPIEFYKVEWKSFKGDSLSSYNKVCSVSTIDTSEHNYSSLIGSYINDDILSVLTEDEQKQLGIAYRINKSKFSEEQSIENINKSLMNKKILKDRIVSLNLFDMGLNNWKKELCLSIDNVPYTMSGKGTQNIVKINLALNKLKEKSDIILVEEPENHLSYSNMNLLIDDICKYKDGKQIFIVTHSNFIANKIGLKELLLINDDKVLKFNNLEESTVKYFMKLPGFDTLRLILSNNPILVEGPSDELIIQKAYLNEYGTLPINSGIDVISIRGLSFLRFCELAEALRKKIKIVTDNDGDIEKNINEKYKDYLNSEYIKIYYNKNESENTLEPSFVNSNNFDTLKEVLNSSAKDSSEITKTMENDKTGWALKVFDTDKKINFPEYINECIKE